MEISVVRRRVVDAIDRAHRRAADRRARAEEATRDYARFLEHVATPLVRQVASVLKAHGYPFTVFTPSGSIRLMSDKQAEDFIDLSLDTSGDEPAVIGHSSRRRGSRIVETERPISTAPISELAAEDVLQFLLEELAPFVER